METITRFLSSAGGKKARVTENKGLRREEGIC